MQKRRNFFRVTTLADSVGSTETVSGKSSAYEYTSAHSFLCSVDKYPLFFALPRPQKILFGARLWLHINPAICGALYHHRAESRRLFVPVLVPGHGMEGRMDHGP